MRWWRELKGILRGDLSFAELTRPGVAWQRCRRTVILLRETYGAATRTDLGRLANALSYKTLMAMIPTLAIFLAAASLADRDGQGSALVAALREKIPDHPDMNRILDQLTAFANSAWLVAGGGGVLLLWTAFSLLLSIEDACNSIWQARPRRTWLGRASSYLSTLILVPILLSASVFVTGAAARTAAGFEDQAGRLVDWVRDAGIAKAIVNTQLTDAENSAPADTPAAEDEGETEATADSSAEALPADVASRPTPDAVPDAVAPDAAIGVGAAIGSGGAVRPAAVARSWFARVVLVVTSALLTIFGLTAFYYLMPDTTVRLRAALYGGLLSGIAFELAKGGFQTYVNWAARSHSVIYGSLLAVPLFLMWLWLVWWMVLLGAELSFVAQNFADLAHRSDHERRGGRAERTYLAVRTVLAAARRFRDGRDPSDLPDDTARELSAPAYLTRALAEELAAKGLLRRVQGTEDGYVPGRDPARLTVAMVARAVGGIELDLPEPGPPAGNDDAPPPTAAMDDPARQRLAVMFGHASASLDSWLGVDFSTLLAEEAPAPRPPAALLPPPR